MTDQSRRPRGVLVLHRAVLTAEGEPPQDSMLAEDYPGGDTWHVETTPTGDWLHVTGVNGESIASFPPTFPIERVEVKR